MPSLRRCFAGLLLGMSGFFGVSLIPAGTFVETVTVPVTEADACAADEAYIVHPDAEQSRCVHLEMLP